MRICDATAESLDGIGFQDNSISYEYRLFGPPGTGKTTRLAELIRRDATKHGAGGVLVTSFSRTAAAELVNCHLPVLPGQVGTLHSHCYRALGSPAIAEAHLDDWNCSNPALALTPVKDQQRLHGDDGQGWEEAAAIRPGDPLLQAFNVFRGCMIDRSLWPAAVLDFERRWNHYKQGEKLLDFCDLIENCWNDISVAPGSPSVIFADEAQDLNPLQLTLLRRWGRQANYVVFAFDDDQTIFTFTGASPEAILTPSIPQTHQIILAQSYRIPGTVHQVADRLIRQVTRRQPKEYRPRPEPGSVVRFNAGSYKSPEYFLLSTATKHLDRGKSVMFLASSSYMLRPLLAVLRKQGLAFHNPYRKANGFWNPLRLTSRGSAARRVLALIAATSDWGGELRNWKPAELLLWTEWLEPRCFREPEARDLFSPQANTEATWELLAQVFEPGALASLLAAHGRGYKELLSWWSVRLCPQYRARVAFAVEVARNRGLIQEPKIVVGTIHSVKGAEADVVYLFPDLSGAADAQYQQHGLLRDSVLRVFYVGVTRARETLYICSAEAAAAISL
jgi:DNA helicase-2/ATP-dependent DNA helicase PcrA